MHLEALHRHSDGGSRIGQFRTKADESPATKRGAIPSTTLSFFKEAFSTFSFKFGATLRRQAERSDSEARHKAPNLT